MPKISYTQDGKTTLAKLQGHTVSIYEGVNGNPYFQVSWTVGKQRYKKKFSRSDRTEGWALAKQKAETVLHQLAGGAGAAAEASPSVLSYFSLLADKLGEAELMQALERVAKRHVGSGHTVRGCVDAYLQATAENHRSKRHIETLRHHLLKFAGKFSCCLEDVTTHDVDRYLVALGKPKTRKNHRASIVAMFNFAKRKGWLPADKLTAPELTEKPNLPKADPEVFTPEELKKLLATAREKYPGIIPYLVIAAFNGARSAEICRLQWRHYDESSMCLLYPSVITKTARRRVSEVTPNLAVWLAKFKTGTRPDDYIVPKPYRTNINRALARLAGEAGVCWKQNALRHSFCSYHLELYGNAPLTAKLCGNSVRVLETVYAQLTRKNIAEAWFAIHADGICHP